MAITAAGIGSGIDIENIVSQLMSLERRPLEALQRKVASTGAEISALGSFKSQVSTFRDAMQGLGTLDAFRKFAAESTDERVATVSADSKAATGNFSLEVERLAQNSRYGSREFDSGATVGGGAGDALLLSVAGESMSVDLSSAKTIEAIRDAINAASDNPGVTATVLNVGGDKQRLLLTADESGFEKRVDVSFGGSLGSNAFDFTLTNKDAFGAPLGNLQQLDAAFSIDGYALTAASNNVGNAIDGINLQLRDTGSAVIALSRDDAAIADSAKKFVDAYNALLDNAAKLASGNNNAAGSLARSVESSLRNTLNLSSGAVDGTYTALSQVGIKTNATSGRLEFDSDDFEAALANDFTSVAQLFADKDRGIAFRLDTLAKGMVEDDGLIEIRVDTLNDRKRSLENDGRSMESRLELTEKAMRAKYAALDSLVGRLQSTSSFLMQNLLF
jgi:flagellar hook-associated protein 2